MGNPKECQWCSEVTPSRFLTTVSGEPCCVWCAAHDSGESFRSSCCDIAVPRQPVDGVTISCPCKYREEFIEAENQYDGD